MSLFKKTKSGGFMDVIRCDEPSYLIWKWHPSGSVQGNNNRENSIRFGSSLRVKDGEVAVFVYKQDDDIMQDYIVGPYDQIIRTSNFPVLASIAGLLYEGGTPFQAEIYFINTARIIQVKFGVPFFDVYDPRFTDFSVPVAVRGSISFSITDFLGFIKLHRLSNFDLNDFQLQIRDVISRYIKNTVSNAPSSHNIPVVQIESKIAQINDIVEYDIAERLRENFGITVSCVDIGAIEIDKSSEGYRRLIEITRDIEGGNVKAEAYAGIKNIIAKQKIEEEHYRETLRMKREEEQYAAHKATQSSNLSAYQIEKQTEVGVAGSEALGKMNESGAGRVNLGESGFNAASMMASMAVGGAVGQNIAGTMNNLMSGLNQQGVQTPPPLPKTMYYLAVNGNTTGPFDIQTLSDMAVSGDLSKESYVWKQGMSAWEHACRVDELKVLFALTPPPPPIG